MNSLDQKVLEGPGYIDSDGDGDNEGGREKERRLPASCTYYNVLYY